MKILVSAAIAASGFLVSPAAAQEIDPLAPMPAQPSPAPAPAPIVAPLKSWPLILNAVARGEWELAQRSILAMDRRDPLYAYALAELYTAPGSPLVSGDQAASLVAIAPELPQAGALSRLARERGSVAPPTPVERGLVSIGSASRRFRAASVGDPVGERVRAKLEQAIETNDGPAAEQIYRQAVAYEGLTGEAQAEIAQRAAWIYFVSGDMGGARRMALEGMAAGRGEWRAQSAWVLGLASWRQNDCNTAASAFRETALGTRDRELGAAGHYWTARAEQACRRPQRIGQSLRAAAVDPETFYGQLARERLGERRQLPERVEAPTPAQIEAVAVLPNVARARALVAMDRRAQAEALLRHQARIGDPSQHQILVRTAADLGLGVQYYLATNAPRGTLLNARDRYPAPGWTPDNGWRIDPYLAFAHIIQESDFRESVVSPADAVGLMQVRPGTARDTARSRGQSVTAEQLKDPETNIDHGQAFIEQMRRNPATRDQLMRVIAAYNAGPVPVARWAAIPGDDPLLWMESLPYWETRFYIPSVLRNYFVYHAEAGTTPAALRDLVQGRPPTYPATMRP